MIEETFIDGIPIKDYGKPVSQTCYPYISCPEFQEVKNGVKCIIPIMSNFELEELQGDIKYHYNDFIEKINETISRDKEIIILREIIKFQDEEIKKLKKERGNK